MLAALVVICMVSRLLFMGEYLEGWDSIDFALGLHDYDIAYYQPHFPGYPVYMFLCWLVHLFTDNDTTCINNTRRRTGQCGIGATILSGKEDVF